MIGELIFGIISTPRECRTNALSRNLNDGKNGPVVFFVILLADKQTNKRTTQTENITALAEVLTDFSRIEQFRLKGVFVVSLNNIFGEILLHIATHFF